MATRFRTTDALQVGELVWLDALLPQHVRKLTSTERKARPLPSPIGIVESIDPTGTMVRVLVGGERVTRAVTRFSRTAFGVAIDDGNGRPTVVDRALLPTDLLLGPVQRGELLLSLSQPARDLANAPLNVRSFGATGDGESDDLPAFRAAIAAMCDPMPEGIGKPYLFGNRLYVPPGTYRLRGDLHITRDMILEGAGFGSHLQFDAGRSIIVDFVCTAPDSGNGDGALIRDLRITADNGDPIDAWAPAKSYAVGDRVLLWGESRFYFECIRGGESGEVLPTLFRTTASAGLEEGATTYDRWRPGQIYRAGSTIVARHDSGLEFCFICESTGTSGASEPAWIFSNNTTTRELSGVIWRMSHTASRAEWKRGVRYELGSVVVSTATADGPRDCYLCTRDGISGNAQPTWSPDVGGTTVELGDGTPAWKTVRAAAFTAAYPDYAESWTPSKRVRANSVIRATKPDLESMGHTTLFLCAQDGATGTHEPPWTTVEGSDVSDGEVRWKPTSAANSFWVDGTVIWACRVGAGIFVRAPSMIERVTITNAINAAIHIQASTNEVPKSGANNWRVQQCVLSSNGGGMFVAGADANAGVALGVSASSNRGVGFRDASFLGNTYVACHTEANAAGSYWMGSSPANNARNVLVGCYAEADQGGARVYRNSIAVGGALGTYFSSDTNGGVLTDTVMANIVARPLFSSRGSMVQLNPDPHRDDVLAFTSLDEGANQSFALRHDESSPGWWRLGLGPTRPSSLWSVSGAIASEGRGLLSLDRGYFRGASNNSPYTGFVLSDRFSSALRGGYRVIGDRFETNETHALEGYVCIEAGWEGDRERLVSGSYLAKVDSVGLEAPTIAHENGFVYACTRGGAVSSEATALDPNAWPTNIERHPTAVWQSGQRFLPHSRVRPTTDNGWLYEVAFADWSANEPVVADRLYRPSRHWSKPYRLGLKLYGISYVPNTNYGVSKGQLIVSPDPSVRTLFEVTVAGRSGARAQMRTDPWPTNGDEFSASNNADAPRLRAFSRGGEVAVPRSGDTEPLWPLEHGGTVVDGDVTWLAYELSNGAGAEPAWPADATEVWDCGPAGDDQLISRWGVTWKRFAPATPNSTLRVTSVINNSEHLVDWTCVGRRAKFRRYRSHEMPVVLWEADFTQQLCGVWPLAPFGLRFARASPGFSVQIDEHTVRSGGELDHRDGPRFGRKKAADPVALVIEEARANVLPRARRFEAPHWLAGVGVIESLDASASGPDGASPVQRCTLTTTNIESTTTSGAAVSSASIWLRAADAQAQYRVFFGNSFAHGVADDLWIRVELSLVGVAFGTVIQLAPGIETAPASRDALYDLAQMEVGAFATEAIPTTSVSRERAGERLTHPRAEALLDDGYLSLEIRLRPKAGPGHYVDANNASRFVYLWCQRGSDGAPRNYARFLDGVLEIAINGNVSRLGTLCNWTTTAQDFFVVVTPIGAVDLYWRDGAALGVAHLSAPAPPGAASAPVLARGPVDLLCDGDQGQFTAWVELLRAYTYREAPDWVRAMQ